MNKSFLSGILLFCSGAALAQNTFPKSTSTPTVVQDKLHYYQNKYYGRTGSTSFTTYPSYKSDATALVTYTNITYVGSRFEVPAGETVTVTGLEGYVAKGMEVVDISIPIRFYLCSLNAGTGLPVFPPIDSVAANIGGSGTPPPPQLIGGSFTNTSTFQARVLTSDFAVLARNISVKAGNYVYFLRTPCITATNTVQHGMHKYADEDYGFVRFNGQFYSTKNFVYPPDPSAFGYGTNYEFMVAPIVEYSLRASQILPSGVVADTDVVSVPDTLCNRAPYVFTNNSSKFYLNRQYNLNELYRQKQFYQYGSDSTFSWNFEFLDHEGETRRFLPRSTNNITVASGFSMYKNCFTVNQFRARFKGMNVSASGTLYTHNEGFKICNRWCYNDAVGIEEAQAFEELSVFPNPAVNGRATIMGFKGANTVEVYNMTGQLIFLHQNTHDNMDIDLSARPKGVYMLRISDAGNHWHMLKIINAD